MLSKRNESKVRQSGCSRPGYLWGGDSLLTILVLVYLQNVSKIWVDYKRNRKNLKGILRFLLILLRNTDIAPNSILVLSGTARLNLPFFHFHDIFLKHSDTLDDLHLRLSMVLCCGAGTHGREGFAQCVHFGRNLRWKCGLVHANHIGAFLIISDSISRFLSKGQ